MEPERDNGLVELVDRLLNKGLIISADVIISVAGVPLIGVNLKAALASIETMLDYGMMEAWDRETREWYSRERAVKEAALLHEGEQIILRTFGSLRPAHGDGVRKPGFWYLTNERLFLKNGEESILDVSLESIDRLSVNIEEHNGKEHISLFIESGNELFSVHAPDVEGMKAAIEENRIKKSVPYPAIVAGQT